MNLKRLSILLVIGILLTLDQVIAQLPSNTWVLQNSGTASNLLFVKAVNHDVAWAGGSNGTVLLTVDGGNNWRSCGGDTMGTADVVSLEAVNQDTAFVLTNPRQNIIYRTSNGGMNWSRVFIEPSDRLIYCILMTNSIEGVAIGEPAYGKWLIMKTTDAGLTWARIPTEPPKSSNETGLTNGGAIFGDNQIWFINNRGDVRRSSDGGATWLAGPSTWGIRRIWFNTSELGLLIGRIVIKTTDAGMNWRSLQIFGADTSTAITSVSGRNSSFYISRDSSVYFSSDQGVSWDISYSGSAAMNQVSFVQIGDLMSGWAVGNNGLIVRRSRYITTGVCNKGIDNLLFLKQNYPNPFNPTTTIEFSLPQSSATLKIFDILGREVATLVNGHLNAGPNEAVWDAGNMPSGVYFYRLEAGEYVATKKLLLLR